MGRHGNRARELIEQHLASLPLEERMIIRRRLKNEDWFDNNFDRILENHVEQWVVIYNEGIVAHSSDRAAAWRTFETKAKLLGCNIEEAVLEYLEGGIPYK